MYQAVRNRFYDVCHNGLDSIALALKGADVTAMDISEESLKYAREYAEMLNVKGIKFVLGDVHNQLDFIENRQFDIVFMTGISGQSQAPVF